MEIGTAKNWQSKGSGMSGYFKEYKPKYQLSKKTEYELLHNFLEQDPLWTEIYYVCGIFGFHQGIKRTIYKFAMRNNLK